MVMFNKSLPGVLSHIYATTYVLNSVVPTYGSLGNPGSTEFGSVTGTNSTNVYNSQSLDFVVSVSDV
jgi:hypothetical protein